MLREFRSHCLSWCYWDKVLSEYIASLTFRVYWWGSRSLNLTFRQIGIFPVLLACFETAEVWFEYRWLECKSKNSLLPDFDTVTTPSFWKLVNKATVCPPYVMLPWKPFPFKFSALMILYSIALQHYLTWAFLKKKKNPGKVTPNPLGTLNNQKSEVPKKVKIVQFF